MRLVRRNSDGESVSLAPLFVVLFLAGLAVLGFWTVIRSSGGSKDPTAKTYAALPPMTFTLGGNDARVVDLRVLLEIEPTVDPKSAISYVPRISDQMADRLRQIEPEQLSGADGAKLVKSALSAVVNREAGAMRVKDVLLERMVVR